MTNRENMSKLLQFLDVKDILKTHWSNLVGWGWQVVCMSW
jgi:hypothetical protein